MKVYKADIWCCTS